MTTQDIKECYLKPTAEFLVQSSQILPAYFIELGCDVCNGRNIKCPSYNSTENTEPMIYTERLKQIKEAAVPSAPETSRERRKRLDLVAVLKSFF